MDVPEPNALDTIDRRLTLSSCHTPYNEAIVELSQSKYIAAQNKDGLTRLHYAVLISEFDIIELILEQPKAAELTNMQDMYGQTPLHLLLARPPLDDLGTAKVFTTCSLFLEKGADPSICNMKGENALHCTVKNQSCDRVFNETRPKILQLFVDRGVPIDSQNGAGETVLHYLCKTEDISNPNLNTRMDLLPTLLACRANLNARNHVTETPLHYAVINLFVGNIKPLIKGGASVHAATDLGDTPLHCVFKNYDHNSDYYSAQLDCAPTLLALGADPNAQNRMGITPFYALMSKPHTAKAEDIAKAMLTTYGANPNIRTKEGFTPLHAAVGGRHLKWVTFLLAHPDTDTSIVHAPTLLRAPTLIGGKTAFDLASEMMLMPPPQGQDNTVTVKLDNLNETGTNNVKAIFELLQQDLFKRNVEKVNSSSNVDAK